VAAPGHGGPPEVEQWGEGCTGSPSRASPVRRRQCGGRAMAVKKRQRRHLVWAALGCREKRRREGRGVVENGGALPLYRGRAGVRRLVIKMEKWPALMGMKWLTFK
jgi:hypothetical protein